MRNPENEAGINAILNVLDEWYFVPERCWPRDMFEEHTYARWAVNEILELLLDNPEDSPDILIENFKDKVSMYWAISGEDSKQSMIFSTAIIVADEILNDIIYLM